MVWSCEKDGGGETTKEVLEGIFLQQGERQIQ